MKTNKFSRVIALLLTLVMLLGTMPTSLAEGMTIVDTAKYELSLEAAANLLYEKLMAATEYEAYAELIKVQLVEHLNALAERYGEDATATLMTHQDELLSAFQAKLQAMQLPSEVVFMTKSYTKAVPMLKKTYVAPITTYGLRSAAMPLAAGDTNDNGLELNKYVSEDGTKLYLEAYATGSTVTTVSTSSKPMDIIFVIDQSGSMEFDFTNNTTSWQLYGDSINSNNLSRYNNGNIWYKVGDNEYVAVTVTRELVDASYQYAKIDSDTTNSTYYDTYRNNLYELLADGTYAQITVTYRTSGFLDSDQTYTYTFADGTSVTSSRNFFEGGAGGLVPNLGRTVYSRATTERYVYRYSYVDSEGTKQYIGTDSEGADTAFGTTFYQRIEAGSTQHRLDALITALNTFVGNVTEDAKGENGVFDGDAEDSDDVDHRIAIVGFSSDGYNNTELLTGVTITRTSNTNLQGNNTKYYPDGYAHNGVQYGNITDAQYAAALQDMTTTAGRTSVDNAIDALTAHGGTNTNEGMDMAREILNNDPYDTADDPYDPEERGRIVILFTDGAPSSRDQNGAPAITIANDLKSDDYQAVVYSVGIFNGADATSAGSNRDYADDAAYGNYLLQQISNNNGTPAANGQTSYYLSAANSSDLNKIFDTISSSAIEGGTITELTTTTVVSDIFSSYFELPEDADEDSIKVYTDTYGPNSAAFTRTWTEFTDAGVVTGVDPTTGEDMLTVTNFNFKENWVGSETAADGTKTYRGKKLIIEVPITPKAGFLGGNNVPTNSTADVFAPNEEGTLEWVEAFPFPDTDVPVKAITPTIVDQHVYLTNAADLKAMIGLDDEQKYRVYTLNGETYSVNGTNNAYVDIIYTFKDDAGNVVATYTIPKGQTDGEIVYTGNMAPMLTGDTKYTITCTVDGSTRDENGVVTKKNEAVSGPYDGWVYIYKPVLTYKDSKEEYLDTMSEADEQAYYAANNLVSKVWKHGDTLSTSVTMSGTKPTLDLTYTADHDWLDSSMNVISTTDVPVNVTVKVGDQDITSQTTTIRNVCTLDGLDKECGHDEQSSGTADAHDPEFVVHVYNVYGHLKFSKVVADNDTSDNKEPAAAQEFTFTVTLTDKSGTPLTEEFNYTGSKSGTIAHNGTITLTAGQSVTISELPPETKYTVTEAALVGYTSAMVVVNDNTLAGQIDAGKMDELKFTNTYKVGDLKITKNIVDENGKIVSDINVDDDVFTFTVTIGGVAQTVTISGAKSTIIADIPYGTTYSVVEQTPPTGYTMASTVDNGTGTIIEGVSEVVVTNTYKTGDLEISKTVEGTYAPKDDTFTFTVVLPDGTFNYVVKDAADTKVSDGTVKNGGTIRLTGGQTATITGLPVGATYTVTETENDDYQTTSSGTTGTISTTPSKAEFTNTYLYQQLTINKTVVDPTFAADEEKTFSFTIAPLSTENAWQYAKFAALNLGQQTIEVNGSNKRGSVFVIVPVGSYVVTETAAPGYTTLYQVGTDSSSDPMSVAVMTGNDSSVSVTNTRIVQDISVTKDWQDNDNALGLRPTQDDKPYVNVTLNGANTLTLNDANNWESGWTNLPTHDLAGNPITYTVTETPVEHYATTYALNNGTASENAPAFDLLNGDAAVTINNSITVGNLAISKTVVNDTGFTPATDEFTFQVELKDKDGNLLTEAVTYSGSKEGSITPDSNTITLTGGQTVTIGNLLAGTKYTVTETNIPVGFKLTTETNASGEIAAGQNAAAAFTNTFKVADLTVTKVITGGDENTSDDIFTFEIELPEGTYVIEGAKTIGADGTVADLTTLSVGDDGKAMFVLVGPSTATIKNIPINTTYTVEEVELPTGYTKASEQNVSGTIPDSGVTVTVTNAYAKGGLTIEKEVIGTDAPKATETFTFTVEVKDAAGNAIAGTYAYTIGTVAGSITTGTANEAERQITLKHGEKAIFETLPTGAVVTVTETENADYVTTPALVQTSTITAVTSELKFTNTYQYGSLTISKSGIDTTLDPNAKTVYRVTGNGVDLTVVVDENGSVEINRLPLGDYTVTELTDWSWRYKATTDNPQTGTITATKNAAVAFGNERDKTQWLDGETSAENIFDPVTEQQEVSENE